MNGGAIALGHPLGCTGAKLTATILREMKRRNAKYGMVSMCIGGGQGAAGIFENLQLGARFQVPGVSTQNWCQVSGSSTRAGSDTWTFEENLN